MASFEAQAPKYSVSLHLKNKTVEGRENKESKES
jgi:hypothetical protein